VSQVKHDKKKTKQREENFERKK